MTPQGTPHLPDKWTIEKPDLDGQVTVEFAPHPFGSGNKVLVVANHSPHGLNGAQLVLRDCGCDGPVDDTHTVAGDNLVITLGRIAPGATVSVPVSVRGGDPQGELRSATAQPVRIGHGGSDGDVGHR